ncbi:lipoprotein N-acyltransferase Lnb domain-containing protein [Winogradskyella alexanderae]|uniref:DUF4105 domain-containing protein n=1 Tax=Winogradskyella alexanderae TaxID=2877123 RepID=A0ABS7XSP8_9FLAO|nr:DUF4105 domain-containing protein [Winogradskyella alexanderae]MCA0131962.1 DUF4105 domain-containing protein [Winogradskyella alexanderae]
MRFKLSFLVGLLIFVYGFGQQITLTPNAEVSVLTVGPGKSLNDAFGHNAFRIKDVSRGIDVTYGYGEYDFDAPNFYLKFAQGKLNYLISRHNYDDFYRHYVRYNRTVKEQILNFDPTEKQALFDYLENNYKPENRRYLYDFFYDNCATRIRDVSQTVTNNKIKFNSPDDLAQKTFRELIYEHVNKNSWGSFGIDLALGSVIDQNATPNEYMFLPKYINSYFENSTYDGMNSLVNRSKIIYKSRPEEASFNFLISPLFVIGLISALILFITYKDYKNQSRSKWLDVSLFCLTGIVGLILFLLWFATDHSATANNYNLLWAFPLNFILIRQMLKPKMKSWVKGYLKFLIIMLCLMTLHWFIGVQVFAIGLIPLLLALFLRYVYLVRTF